MQTFEGVSSALDDIAGMMGSCRIYERIHLSYVHEFTSAQAVIAYLPKLYTHCLGFMAEAIEYFQTDTASELPRLLLWITGGDICWWCRLSP